MVSIGLLLLWITAKNYGIQSKDGAAPRPHEENVHEMPDAQIEGGTLPVADEV